MARHSRKSTVSDNGRKRKSETKGKERLDEDTDDDRSEDEEPKAKKSPGKKSPVRKSDGENSDSFEEDEDKSDESDSEPASPSRKKKRVSFTPKDEEEDENYESDKKRSVKKTKANAKAKSKPEEDNYEVEAIVGDRVIKGHVQYKVRWKGFGSDDDTWEGEDNLNCPDLIEEYNDTKADDEVKSPKKKKKDNSSDDGANSGSEADDYRSTKKKGRPKKAKRGRPVGGGKMTKNGTKSTEDDKSGPGPMPDGEYKVSRIIDMHTLKTGKREFLVRWQGWSEKDDTWEPEENLQGNDKLEKFFAKLEKIKEVDTKELRVNRTATNHFRAGQNKSLAAEGRMRESKRFQNKTRSDEEDGLSESDRLSDTLQRGSEDNDNLIAGETSKTTGKRRRGMYQYRLGRLIRDQDVDERQLALEERQAAIEERKLRLKEKQLDFEMNERELRLSSDIEDRKQLVELSKTVEEQRNVTSMLNNPPAPSNEHAL